MFKYLRIRLTSRVLDYLESLEILKWRETVNEDEIKEEIEIYRRRRNFLIDVGREASRSYDKYILTLAAGTFGLSLLFLERLTNGPVGQTKWFLITSWIAFGASILSTLLSFLLGQESSSKEIEILDSKFKRAIKEDENVKNSFSTWIKWLNRVSMILFIIGVILLATFSSLNIK